MSEKIEINLTEEGAVHNENSPNYNQETNLTDLQQNNDFVEDSITSEKKTQQQFKALFYKSVALQTKQIGTNICQILTPLICLIFVFLIKQLAQSQTGSTFSLPFPFIFNVPGLYNAYPFVHIECLEWYMYDVDSEASEETKDFIGYNSGILGETPQGLLKNIAANEKCRYQPMPDKDIQERMVPFFEHPPQNQTINEALFNTLTTLNTMPYQRGLDIEGSAYLPDGAVRFFEANDNKLRYSVQINDVRMREYHRNNGITKLKYTSTETDKEQVQIRVAEGMLSLIDLINRAYLRTINDNVWIVSGVQYMPLVGEDTGFIMRIISVTGASLYPLALSLLLPIFMYTIVLEKEEKLLEMMKMNGMRMKDYWLITFLFYAVITFLTFTIFYLFGYFIVSLDFFTDTGPSVLITILAGWGFTQISMSFFFQVFLGKARSATIIGYLLSIWTSLIAVTFNIAVYPQPYELPYGMRIYPPLAFSRLIYDVSIACSNGACFQELSQMTDEMNDCMIYLYTMGVLFLVLGLYLHEVVPQEYGTQKHPLFFLDICNGCKKKKQKSQGHQRFNDEGESDAVSPEFYQDLEEDEDSKKERQFVHNLNEPYQNYPLILKDLRKQYKQVGGRKSHVAVKCLSLTIKKGEIFGLLGPNGSGKTTTISMVTGMFPPTAGNAWIAGYDIKTSMDQVHLSIGVCPQFDLLWPELTVHDHLMFYARLKGVPPTQQKVKVEKAIKEVYLTKFTNYRVKQLSGGMKRRLSVAISLVGDPKIIFLDEPSTGLDPENRRQLWDILSECRGKRAMVLTTHSMEEADVLCTKIGIITDGILRCIGPQVRLKGLYGGGYHLYINCHKDKYLEKLQQKEKHEEQKEQQDQQDISDVEPEENKLSAQYYQKKVEEFINQILPNNKLITSFNGNIIYQVPMEGLKVSKLFEELEQKKEQLRISDWGISQSSLEDVFMQIVDRNSSADAEDEE